jgi:hypothetical protein
MVKKLLCRRASVDFFLIKKMLRAAETITVLAAGLCNSSFECLKNQGASGRRRRLGLGCRRCPLPDSASGSRRTSHLYVVKLKSFIKIIISFAVIIWTIFLS